MATTLYTDVYDRALREIKDAELKRLSQMDTILFYEIMWSFLENAIASFTDPIDVIDRLSDKVEPELFVDTFTGDGRVDTFKLTEAISEDVVDFYLFKYEIDNRPVCGEYNPQTNSVQLLETPKAGSNVEISYYFIGYWNTEIPEQERYVLSKWLVAHWSENVNNNRLDIDRLLGDTDFKLVSNSSTTTAKTGWYSVNRENAVKAMNKYAWYVRAKETKR